MGTRETLSYFLKHHPLFDTTQDETGEEIFFNWIAVDKGYVHKSRLKKIYEFPSIGKGKKKETEIVSPLLKRALVLLLLDSYLIKLNTRLLRKTREVMRS